MTQPVHRGPGANSKRAAWWQRLLRLPAWRAGVVAIGFASAIAYVMALELDVLMAQLFAAFATGGSIMVGFGRYEG